MNAIFSRICISLSIFLSVLVFSGSVQANAEVEGLQSPAWVMRERARLPIRPGMKLLEGDQLGTGDNGRLLIRTSEGSQVKLGENAQFSIRELKPQSSNRPFRGVWNVLRGAFRFTTSAVGHKYNRSIDINVGVATAGIRGTDLWGKSNGLQDLICLIDGKIDVTRSGKDAVTMKPLTVYRAKRNSGESNVTPVDMDELGRWALETELSAGAGVMNESGRYRVNLITSDDITVVQSAQGVYENAGYPADITKIKINGDTRYRLGISGLASYSDAQSLAQQVAATQGADDAWVSLVW